jgi:hypothetical protein
MDFWRAPQTLTTHTPKNDELADLVQIQSD